MSISKLYKNQITILKSAGIDSAEIDVQVLIEFVSKKSREFLLAHPEYKLSKNELKKLMICVDRRKSYEPIAYIIGKKEFFGNDFLLTKDVLIPRPETEMLVEEAIEFVKKYCLRMKDKNFSLRSKNTIRILDVGTGSGNIIISIAKYLKNNPLRFKVIDSNLTFCASDISQRSLKIAKKNAEKHRVEKLVKFIRSDLFDQINAKYYDLILANLPYVPEDNSKIKNKKSKFKNRELSYEPKLAIFADDNGMTVIKKFLVQAKNRLNSGGVILIEVDPRNAKSLAKFTAKLFASFEIIKDYYYKDRFIKISD